MSASATASIAFEVVVLIGLFREHWDAIKGRSALQEEELEHGGQLAQQLVTAIGYASRRSWSVPTEP